MTKVAILPVTTDQGNLSYHAIAGAKQSSVRLLVRHWMP